MARFYANRIKQGKMSLLDVPARYREQVEQILIDEYFEVGEDGYIINAVKLEDK